MLLQTVHIVFCGGQHGVPALGLLDADSRNRCVPRRCRRRSSDRGNAGRRDPSRELPWVTVPTQLHGRGLGTDSTPTRCSPAGRLRHQRYRAGQDPAGSGPAGSLAARRLADRRLAVARFFVLPVQDSPSARIAPRRGVEHGGSQTERRYLVGGKQIAEVRRGNLQYARLSRGVAVVVTVSVSSSTAPIRLGPGSTPICT